MDFILKRILPLSLALYTVAILSSMAGMEIFGWLSATLVLVLLMGGRIRWPEMLPGDWALVGLLGVVTLGALLNTPEPKSTIDIIGSFRFVPLFLLLRVGILSVWDLKSRHWLVTL